MSTGDVAGSHADRIIDEPNRVIDEPNRVIDEKNGDFDEAEQLDCSAVIADVWLLLDNECDQHARARLQSHLDGCTPCLEHYGIEQQLKSLVSRKCGGDQAPKGLRERLTLEIRKTVIIRETRG